MGRQSAWWKRVLPVQAPYRWHLRRMRLGRTLDLGCGNGRNLRHLSRGSVGVDHNEQLVAVARASGLDAMTPEEFRRSPHARPEAFDSLLASHLVEHMRREEAERLLRDYVGYVRSGGRVVFITPQERGFATDPTHVEFTDFEGLRKLAGALGLEVERTSSFPFPRSAGRIFAYNEFVVVARRADVVA